MLVTILSLSLLKSKIQMFTWMINVKSFSSILKNNEPSHEIKVHFILRKLILQTHMRDYPIGGEGVGQDV